MIDLIFIGELTILLPLLIALAMEKLRPADSTVKSARFNLIYAVVVTLFSAALLEPLTGVELAYFASRFGTAPISLWDHGWMIAVSVLVLLAFKDFLDYWFHRAQHRFVLLWSMHSFHHSDGAMNVTTSQRHFWLDRALLVCVIYIPIGLIFRFDGKTALFFSLGAMFFSLFPHMNLRIEFGRLSWITTGPQLHRLHHSVLAKHYNANYAGMFPIWDVMFGTYTPPQPREFPKTGIPEAIPEDLVTALLWPFKARDIRS